MAENGDEKLIVVARHIARSLGHTDNAITDDIIQIFSNFDGRFREKLTGNLSGNDGRAEPGQMLKTIDRRVSRYLTVDEPVTDYNITIEALSSGTINNLHEIAKRMLEAGYGKECSLAYSTCRRDFLVESLSRLGFLELQNSNEDDNDMEIERCV